jgi:hypothetical protein
MSRLVVITLIASLAGSSAAFAGEGLMQSASRIVLEQTVGTTPAAPAGDRGAATKHSAKWVRGVSSPTAQAQQGQPMLSKSGMKTRTKVMIFLAAGVGLAATAYTIDHNVVDVTPSSLGTRKD